MRLAVLGDAVGEAPETPGLGLRDLSAIVFDDFGGVFRERIDLSLSEVLAREENMLVERHVSILSFGRSLTRPDGTPLRLSSKKLRAQRQGRAPAGGPMAQDRRKGKRAHELRRSGRAQTKNFVKASEPQRVIIR